MTKRFALADTLPTAYFTIDTGEAAVTIKTSQTDSGRSMVEVWRDGQILCRIFASSVHTGDED